MKKLDLYYSKIFSIPILNELLYVIELLIFAFTNADSYYASSKKSLIKKILFAKLDSPQIELFVKSFRFGFELKKFKSAKIYLDSREEVTGFNAKNLYNYMWSTVIANRITLKTYFSNKLLLPSQIQKKTTIIISSWERFDAVCDHIYQTVQELSKRDDCVIYLLAHAYPKNLFEILKKREINLYEKVPQNVRIIYPFQIFGHQDFSWKLQQLNNSIKYSLLSSIIKKIDPDLIWCFDPADISLIKKIGNTKKQCIYDCVDDFGSREKSIDQQIKNNEKELLKYVDYFFVNSYTLRKIKSRLTKNKPIIVPLGFDEQSFNSKKPLSSTEIREVKKVRSLAKTRKIVGYIGSVNYRFNFEVLKGVITSNPSVYFVFTDYYQSSKTEDPLGTLKALWEEVKKLPNVILVTSSYNRNYIGKLIEFFDLAIVPYDTKLPFNKHCFPMKFMEYLYYGKKVLSTEISELEYYKEYVITSDSPEYWSEIVAHLEKNARNDFSIRIALEHTWKKKVDFIISTITE